MAKHGKKYLAAAAKVNIDEQYLPANAMKLVKETSYANFDSTIEVHLRMCLDPRQAVQLLRGVVVLPHGLGKTERVSDFDKVDAAVSARTSRAHCAVGDDATLMQYH